MKNIPLLRRFIDSQNTAARLAGLLLVPLVLAGCTSDGQVREVDGQYRKVYPDRNGGWYYLDSHSQKIHLDELPPERGLMPSEHNPSVGDRALWGD